MNDEPRPAICMEKQLGWTHKLGGMEYLGISRAEQTVLGRLMETYIWHQPASSIALWLQGSEKGQWPVPTFLSGRNLSPSSHLDARHFSSCLCPTGAFQAGTLVLELRGSESD